MEYSTVASKQLDKEITGDYAKQERDKARWTWVTTRLKAIHQVQKVYIPPEAVSLGSRFQAKFLLARVAQW